MTTSRVTSSARVTFYTKASTLSFNSASTVAATKASGLELVACESSNTLASGGAFSATFKFTDGNSPLLTLEDDAWVDISYAQNGIYTHCFRGIVDDVRVTEDASRGTTTRTAVVTGRSFQKAYETTTIFFLPTLAESALVALTQKSGGVGSGIPQVIGSPQQNVKTVLYDLFSYLGTLHGASRSNWSIPPTMPVAQILNFGSTGNLRLDEAVTYDTSLMDANRGVDLLNKTNPGNSTTFQNEINVWQLAKQFADEPFCEMFTDLVPIDDIDNVSAGVSESQTRMTIVMRDRPYLLASSDTGRLVGQACNYFDLPIFAVKRQDITTISYGRTGLERFNAFSVAVAGDIQVSDSDLRQPLWNTADMALHGLRRMDLPTVYFNKGNNLTAFLRAQLRDYYCTNPLLYSGTANLAFANLNLRVGCRVQFVDMMEAYIESVRHMWRFNALRTDITFTRGFAGDASGQLASIAATAQNYQVAAAS